MNYLIAMYIASVPSSLIVNLYYTTKEYNKIIKDNKRKFKYRDKLNFRTKYTLSQVKVEKRWDIIDDIKESFIPIKNFLYTYNSIEFQEESFLDKKEFVDKIYEDASKKEYEVRKMNVDFLNSIKKRLYNLPKTVDLDDQEYRPGDKEVKKILKLNKMNYDEEMHKYEVENNIKY